MVTEKNLAARLRQLLGHARENWGEYKGLLSLDAALEEMRVEALEARSVPEGLTLETTAEERASLARTEAGISLRPGDVPGTVLRLLRDHDTLTAALVATRQELAETILVLDSTKVNVDRLLAAKDAEIAEARGVLARCSSAVTFAATLKRAIDAETALAAEKEKREAAEAALRPFDVLGEETPEEAKRPDYWDAIASCGRVGLWDLGDLRRARAVLSNKTGGTTR